jgi:hypothetical protein
MKHTTESIIKSLRAAAGRLEELQRESDEARAEVERLNAYPTRLEPSRLEIAAMLKAGWFANRDADFNATDHKWWIKQADALIAAAKEGK